jgi:hypothetical protein
MGHRRGRVGGRPAWLLAVVAGVLVMCVAGQNLLATWRHAHHADGARLVTIAPPPQVDAAGAHALWANLAGILTPSRRKRILHGSPHVQHAAPGLLEVGVVRLPH